MSHNRAIRNVPPGNPPSCRCQDRGDFVKTIESIRATNEQLAIFHCQRKLNSTDPDLTPSLRVELNVFLAGYPNQSWRTHLANAETAMAEWQAQVRAAGLDEGHPSYPQHINCLLRRLDHTRSLAEEFAPYLRPEGAPLRGEPGARRIRIRREGGEAVFDELDSDQHLARETTAGSQGAVDTNEQDISASSNVEEVVEEPQPRRNRAERRARERAERKAGRGQGSPG